MADRNCTTTAVDDVKINFPGVDACQGLHRECFVELHRADALPKITSSTAAPSRRGFRSSRQ
jgi:hypothetical protein